MIAAVNATTLVQKTDSTFYADTVDGGVAVGIDGYSWTYDDAGRVASLAFDDGTGHSSEDATYSYDNSGQLTGANRSGTAKDEAYTYDANGNRIHTTDSNTGGSTLTSTTGDANQLASDGTYTYEYDLEGNRVKRTSIAEDEDGHPLETTTYAWDYRNRLTEIDTYAGEVDPDNLVKQFIYTYDVFDRRIVKNIYLADATIGPQGVTQFVYDAGGASLLVLLDGAGSLTHRFLEGPAVNQILADESIGGFHDGQVVWALTDNLGTPRDLVRLVAGDSGATSAIANHLVYDSFGNVVFETRAVVGDMDGDGVVNGNDIAAFVYGILHPGDFATMYPTVTDWQDRGDMDFDQAYNGNDIYPFVVTALFGGTNHYAGHAFTFGFAGYQRDDESGNLYAWKRYYVTMSGIWMSPDPLGLGPDVNPRRYVDNSPTNAIDPSGLAAFDVLAMWENQCVSALNATIAQWRSQHFDFAADLLTKFLSRKGVGNSTDEFAYSGDQYTKPVLADRDFHDQFVKHINETYISKITASAVHQFALPTKDVIASKGSTRAFHAYLGSYPLNATNMFYAFHGVDVGYDLATVRIDRKCDGKIVWKFG